MRRTKIVCTLGPSTNSLSAIQSLIHAGMDVARLNFSHGDHQDHKRLANFVREASRETGRHIAILQDLCGPKIRTGRLKAGSVTLVTGQRLTLVPAGGIGTNRRVSVSYPDLASDVKRGNTILLDDGAIELKVLGTRRDGAKSRLSKASRWEVETEIVHGGLLKEHKGVNLPGVRLSVEALTAKDEDDLRFGISLGVDYVALSFVRAASDVRRVKKIIAQSGSDIPVLAKLEKPEAVDHLKEILTESDGVMVARGDLGVELPLELVPIIQKRILSEAAKFRIPAITATQMLESMTLNPRPTRAEASDVANAIFDGSDAVMLSAETASGKYPIEAVEMMARIARQADEHTKREFLRRELHAVSIADAISESVVHATHLVGVKAIVVFTQSGSTARMVSKYRPPSPVYAFCADEHIARRTALYWGVTTFLTPLSSSVPENIARAEKDLLRRKLVRRGDIVAVVLGTPGKPGLTDTMKLIRIGR